MSTRPFQVVVWGASGFTGRLVCEHISKDYKGQINWAMAGRSQEKLESIRADLAEKYGAEISEVPILLGTLEDQSSLENIASQTDVIISTAGPFAKYGTPIVDAAVSESSHYCDITGEVPWVKSLIDKHHEEATRKNVRIVNCCGYDSIPSDLGALFVVEHFKKTFGALPSRVVTAVAEGKGGVSGGTIATGMYQLTQSSGSKGKDKGKEEDSSSTYALIPKDAQRGTDKDEWWTEFCAPLNKYLAPFIMQVCNTRIVQRSNYLLNWGGEKFSYREGVVASGSTSAKGVAIGTIAIGAIFSRPWLHPLLRKFVPAPGQGPSREAMMTGFYKHRVLAEGKDSVVIAEVGDKNRDPGYWGTSRMVLEAALCLALQQKELDADPELVHGGVITPAAAMGNKLIDRLKNNAGLTFEVTEVKKGSA
jgi:short subunit dehydrogenase-like uncharacterized protein